jgi:hypothetical protein
MLLSGSVVPPAGGLPSKHVQESGLRAKLTSLDFHRQLVEELKGLIPDDIGKIKGEKEVKICQILEKFFGFGEIENKYWVDIPERSFFDEFVCRECGGIGKVTECGDCDGEGDVNWESNSGIEYSAVYKLCNGKGVVSGSAKVCDDCGGSGRKKKYDRIYVGSKFLDCRYLELLKQLPGVKIAPDFAKGYSPIPVKFEGGTGLIMPLSSWENGG